MPAIRDKRPGQRLSASEVNAIARAARAGMEVASGDGIVATQGHGGRVGLALAPAPKTLGNVVMAINDNVQAMVMGQPVVLDTITAPATQGPYYWHADWPSTSGRGNLGIVRQTILSGGVGPVYISGYALLLVDSTTIPVDAASGAGVTSPEYVRFGCKKHAQVAIYDRLGPFLCLSSVTRNDGNQWAYVRITNHRGDYVSVKDSAANDFHSGPYRTLVFGKGYTVAETAPGAISVT